MSKPAKKTQSWQSRLPKGHVMDEDWLYNHCTPGIQSKKKQLLKSSFCLFRLWSSNRTGTLSGKNEDSLNTEQDFLSCFMAWGDGRCDPLSALTDVATQRSLHPFILRSPAYTNAKATREQGDEKVEVFCCFEIERRRNVDGTYCRHKFL